MSFYLSDYQDVGVYTPPREYTLNYPKQEGVNPCKLARCLPSITGPFPCNISDVSPYLVSNQKNIQENFLPCRPNKILLYKKLDDLKNFKDFLEWNYSKCRDEAERRIQSHKIEKIKQEIISLSDLLASI